jgi:lipopolysaccharide transport system ATP-binding protein
MGHVAIKTHELGKSYLLGLHQARNLRELITDSARHPIRTMRESRRKPEEKDILWALEDISLTIEDGEVVGLIGHNGAGKSTILKILSRITEPSTGYAEVTGRVGSLLEVGTGFHPELTGRENIFLNGAILGMRRAEIRARFDDIVEFAEVERFLDTPVKRYSSGMSVRLAFAVAAHLEPEILLVDEVLAVGDASFQRRSMAKMTEVAKEGRTVVFVSHNVGTVRALCQRGIMLEQGRIVTDAPVAEAIDTYLQRLERSAAIPLLERGDRDARSRGRTRLRAVTVADAEHEKEEIVVGGRPVRITVEVTEPIPGLECRINIFDGLGTPVARLESSVSSTEDTRTPELATELECVIDPLPLVPGRYRLDVRVNSGENVEDGLEGAAYFDVEQGVVYGRPAHPTNANGDVVLPHTWRLPA